MLPEQVGQQDEVLVRHPVPEVELVVAPVDHVQVEGLHDWGLQLPDDALVGRVADLLAGLLVAGRQLIPELVDVGHKLYKYTLPHIYNIGSTIRRGRRSASGPQQAAAWP